MDVAEAAVSLSAAVIGAAAAIGATFFTVRRAARDARAEARSTERSALEALLIEIEVVEQIAGAASATVLPTRMLDAALAAVHHMDLSEKATLVEYSASVQRYNGRIQRLVAYGAAKRAAGQAPGAEKPDEEQHARPVSESASTARSAIQRQLAAPRLRGWRSV